MARQKLFSTRGLRQPLPSGVWDNLFEVTTLEDSWEEYVVQMELSRMIGHHFRTLLEHCDCMIS
jgi:hypothetical protein